MFKDNLRLGLLMGFLAPMLGMLIYYFLQFRNTLTLSEFFQIIFTQRTLLTAVISVSLVANAILFTLYINKRKDRTAKGIFIVTCIYGVASLFWKFLS